MRLPCRSRVVQIPGCPRESRPLEGAASRRCGVVGCFECYCKISFAEQIGQSRWGNPSRKVRTPKGGIAANGRPLGLGRARNRATETSLRSGRACPRHVAHRHGHLRAAPSGNGWRHRRVKRGNLYPEQHQIGMRAAFGPRRAAPFEHAGRWLQRPSNGPRRGMIVRQGNLVYRIRPIDPSCNSFSKWAAARKASGGARAGARQFRAACGPRFGRKPCQQERTTDRKTMQSHC